jgi:SIR2-like domain
MASTPVEDADRENREPDVPLLDVIHPHGIASGFGDGCVLTPGDYNRLRLAFRVAVAAAYHKPLAIVGMNLDDQYLREQLREFRHEVGRVFWFRTAQRDASTEFAEAHRIEVVTLSGWPQFWTAVSTTLKSPCHRDVEKCVERLARSLIQE